jgi:hypothetical protein
MLDTDHNWVNYNRSDLIPDFRAERHTSSDDPRPQHNSLLHTRSAWRTSSPRLLRQPQGRWETCPSCWSAWKAVEWTPGAADRYSTEKTLKEFYVVGKAQWRSADEVVGLSVCWRTSASLCNPRRRPCPSGTPWSSGFARAARPGWWVRFEEWAGLLKLGASQRSQPNGWNSLTLYLKYRITDWGLLHITQALYTQTHYSVAWAYKSGQNV